MQSCGQIPCQVARIMCNRSESDMPLYKLRVTSNFTDSPIFCKPDVYLNQTRCICKTQKNFSNRVNANIRVENIAGCPNQHGNLISSLFRVALLLERKLEVTQLKQLTWKNFRFGNSKMRSSNFAPSKLTEILRNLSMLNVWYLRQFWRPKEGRPHFEKLIRHIIFLWYTFCQLSRFSSRLLIPMFFGKLCTWLNLQNLKCWTWSIMQNFAPGLG